METLDRVYHRVYHRYIRKTEAETMAKNRRQAEQVADAIIKGVSSICERNGKFIISFGDGSNLELEADRYTHHITGRGERDANGPTYTTLTTR